MLPPEQLGRRGLAVDGDLDRSERAADDHRVGSEAPRSRRCGSSTCSHRPAARTNSARNSGWPLRGPAGSRQVSGTPNSSAPPSRPISGARSMRSPTLAPPRSREHRLSRLSGLLGRLASRLPERPQPAQVSALERAVALLDAGHAAGASAGPAVAPCEPSGSGRGSTVSANPGRDAVRRGGDPAEPGARPTTTPVASSTAATRRIAAGPGDRHAGQLALPRRRSR